MRNGPPELISCELFGGPHDGSVIRTRADMDYVLLADGAIYSREDGRFSFRGFDAFGEKRSVLKPEPTNVQVRWETKQFCLFVVIFVLAVWKLGDVLSVIL